MRPRRARSVSRRARWACAHVLAPLRSLASLFRCVSEAALLAEYEASQAVDDAALAAAAADDAVWQEHGGDDGAEAVRCPVCRRRRLLAHRGVVFCACAGLRLDLSAEGAGLAHVAATLAAAWEAHASSGCRAEPRFTQREAFGTHALWAHCDACDMLQAVL